MPRSGLLHPADMQRALWQQAAADVNRGLTRGAIAALHPETLAVLGRCKHCTVKLDATWQGEHRDGCAWVLLGEGDVSLLRPQTIAEVS